MPASLVGHNQQASSRVLPIASNSTPVATEVTSTQTFISLPFIHQSLQQGPLHIPWSLFLPACDRDRHLWPYRPTSSLTLDKCSCHPTPACHTQRNDPQVFPERENIHWWVTTLASLLPEGAVVSPDLQAKNLSSFFNCLIFTD